jgi:hypothetical protein
MFTQNDNLIHFKLEFMIQFSRVSCRVIERNWKIGPYFSHRFVTWEIVSESKLLEKHIQEAMCQSKLAFGMNYCRVDGKLQIYFNSLPFPRLEEFTVPETP